MYNNIKSRKNTYITIINKNLKNVETLPENTQPNSTQKTNKRTNVERAVMLSGVCPVTQEVLSGLHVSLSGYCIIQLTAGAVTLSH